MSDNKKSSGMNPFSMAFGGESHPQKREQEKQEASEFLNQANYGTYTRIKVARAQYERRVHSFQMREDIFQALKESMPGHPGLMLESIILEYASRHPEFAALLQD